MLGAVAVVHGADTAWAGLKQAFTGEEQKTFTEQGATKLAEAAGASKETAEKIGAGVDMAVGIIPDAVGSLAKNGSKLLSKAGSALEKAGSALKSAGKAIAEGGASTKKLAVEAAHELGRTGAAALAKGKGIIDDVGKILKNPGQVVVAAAGHGMSFMMNVFEDGKAALGGGGGAGKELRDMFRAAGINVHEFTFELNKAAHKIVHDIHNKGIVKSLGLNWNKTWEEWLAGYKKLHGELPGKEEILAQGQKMMEEFGMMHYWEGGGGNWVKYEAKPWIKKWLAKIGRTVDDYETEAKILDGMKKP